MASEFEARTYNTDRSSTLQFIVSHVKRHPAVGIAMIIGATSNAALASAVPFFIGEAYNAIRDNQDLQRVGLMALAIIGSQLLRGVLQLMRNYSAEIFAQRIERDVRDELYASLLGKSMTFHNLTPVGEIMARVTNDVRELNFLFNPGLNLIIGSTMFLILPTVLSPFIHPALVTAPLLFIVAYVFVQVNYVRRIHEVAQRVRASFGQMNARLAESLDGIEVVKGMAQEKSESENFNSLVDRVRSNFIEQADVEARYFAIFLYGMLFVGGFLHAVVLYQNGGINQGDIVNYAGQLALFTFPVFTSIFSLSRLASGYAGGERILNIINEITDLDQNMEGKSATLKGHITFEDVSFSYNSASDKVLQGVSFSIEPGQTVALVGQTGAGKTTVTTLINRTHDVDKGRVLVDGTDVRDWNLESLRSQISIIEQEIFLFSRSIAENISFGRHDATREQIMDAAKKAQAHDFIMGFPEGYDTVIGQRGVTLSGGQRQRLAIARAFLTDPPVLILDDSTSAIDSATEDKIQKAIWSAAKDRTTILITHRLSQIRWADHIIVLRKGQVVAQGKHEDLLGESDTYRRIFDRYEEQTSFYDKDRVKSYLDRQMTEGK
ncbi:MAG: ABC transporter ATP-binding protein [Chloroflexi bacterium]|nr:ABC transporter ATP-binding protein [Chloroflexota bacterium]